MTLNEMETDLTDARDLLSCTLVTIDRCRHESVAETSLWFFDENRQQIGSARRLDATRWTFSRMLHGQPASCRTGSLSEACAHVIVKTR